MKGLKHFFIKNNQNDIKKRKEKMKQEKTE